MRSLIAGKRYHMTTDEGKYLHPSEVMKIPSMALFAALFAVVRHYQGAWLALADDRSDRRVSFSELTYLW